MRKHMFRFAIHNYIWRDSSHSMLFSTHSVPSSTLSQLGYYHRSRIQILNDTSTLARRATSEDSITFSSFRYRVRLAVGIHFLKFYFILLPFYVGLKLWAYLVSILTGVTFGYLYLFVVFKCRQKFRRSRPLVALGSASFLYVVSAAIFQKGMYLVNEAWQW